VTADLQSLIERYIEEHVLHGRTLDAAALCGSRVELIAPLRDLIGEYTRLSKDLEWDPGTAAPAVPTTRDLPNFAGFHTIERIGAGGMGEVFKLRDLRLDRLVAAKVLRMDAALPAGVTAFLGEARSLALFSDRRIVRLLEFRPDATPPVLIMEYVDGFELGRIGPSLEFRQRARVLHEVCLAIGHAHSLGIQHRDLKPSNIMVDAQLTPRILDFGLSGGDPKAGHLKGTLQYVAPEQLEPSRPIDDRSDIYSLGVILYELLCGRPPYTGTADDILAGIRRGRPQLPVEHSAAVPEPLQAVALKAMEHDPAQRYQTAREMAGDLERFLDGRAVLARPSIYSTTLGDRAATHVAHIDEWLRLRLIHPHEAAALRGAYRALGARDDDWIVESRALTYPQIALYLGAFLLLAGSLFYFVAERWYGAVSGLVKPLLVLGAPFAGLNLAARWLHRRDHKAVAVAFYLAAVALLPLLLIIVFHETGFLVVPAGTPGQLFQDGAISNRQLQITSAVATAWAAALALSTRTAALSTVFTAVAGIFGIALLADAGLRSWLVDGRWDRLALHAFPLVAGYAAVGFAAERTGRTWLARPPYQAAAVVLVLVLELLALDGRTFHYLGFSLQGFQNREVSNPLLLDTLAAMTLNGLCFYLVAESLERRGSELQAHAARFLFVIAPFALLQPLGYLVRTTEYSPRWDWGYLAAALSIAVLSHRRQRRAFYYAGVINTGAALLLIAARREWFDDPVWAVTVIGCGLATLAAGFALDRRQRLRR
jgi:serine/threonine protein kinase